jgi:hypothetical protein
MRIARSGSILTRIFRGDEAARRRITAERCGQQLVLGRIEQATFADRRREGLPETARSLIGRL